MAKRIKTKITEEPLLLLALSLSLSLTLTLSLSLTLTLTYKAPLPFLACSVWLALAYVCPSITSLRSLSY